MAETKPTEKLNYGISELASMPEIMVKSLHQLEKTWKEANLPDPFITCDYDEEEKYYDLTASWMRYDIIITILSNGTWRILDLSGDWKDDKDVPSGTTSWCPILANRLQLVPLNGKKVTDMKDWNPLWRKQTTQ